MLGQSSVSCLEGEHLLVSRTSKSSRTSERGNEQVRLRSMETPQELLAVFQGISKLLELRLILGSLPLLLCKCRSVTCGLIRLLLVRRYFFGILSDCTVRKEKELELEARRIKEMEAAANTRAKRSFVTNVSHEIRT
jgi:signal transduction histidine kinase